VEAVSFPVRIAVRVALADGGQHEYEVLSAAAERPGVFPGAVWLPPDGAEALGAFTEARLSAAEASAGLAGECRVAWVYVRDEAGKMLYTTVAAEMGEDDGWVADGKEIVDASAAVFYDPGIARRQVAAGRQILGRWRTARSQADVARVNGGGPEAEAWEKIAGALELDVRSLAAVWDDHPDYKETWDL
jgi:hypothetical protein